MDKENYSPVINSYAAMWEEYREVTRWQSSASANAS